MKIKKIILNNIGPYIGNNVFDLSVNKTKNIILIGGKNGAGKTTFFKSIKTCLYGCKVWGYDAPGKDYYKIIDGIVNINTQYDSDAKAFIQIDILFDDGKQKNIYSLYREWIRTGKNYKETFIIYKNNEKLNEEELLDFNNYLLSIIPPDMFNFYFFDGESIADYFLGNDGKNFRNAFLKLYGLDTLTIMVENFQRYFKKKDSQNTIYDEYIESKNEYTKCENNLLSLKEELKTLENNLDLTQIKLQALQKNYTKEGGVSINDWKNLNSELLKEESLREEINRWLKEVANNYLPFIILKNEINSLSNLLADEEEKQKSQFVKEIINRKEFINKLNSLLDKNNVNFSSSNIIKLICDSINTEDCENSLFDLSPNQIRKLLIQIEDKKSFDTKEIIKSVKQLKDSSNNSKALREKLSKSSIDSFEEFNDQKDTLEKQILELTIEVEKKTNEIINLEQMLAVKKSIFEKCKQNYEGLLKSKSINEMSSRAIAVYTLLEDKLIKQQSIILQDEFYKCFTSIINKNNFLDGIVVDKNINIIPYKLIEVEYAQLDNYLEKNSQTKFLDLFDYKYIDNINKLRLEKVTKIKLPSPITAPFSQGERQVFIMSLYLALLKTSRKDIPFFIDTPFARIDSLHRENIVSNFFLGIKNQIFILSTDEEIVDQYLLQIENKISNKFLLNISGYGKTNIINDKYFGEK